MSENRNMSCPKCGGQLKKGQYGWYCADQCGLAIGKVYGKEITDSQLEKLLDGQEILIKNFVSKNTGNTYDMYVKANFDVYDEYNGKYYIHYETRFPEDETADYLCPHCNGEVIINSKGVPYCKNRCGFVMGSAYGKPLTKNQIKNLVEGKEILVKGFVSKKNGKEYDMYLKMSGIKEYEGHYYMEFDTRFPERTI